MIYYRLENKKPVPMTFEEYADGGYKRASDRRVAEDTVGPYWISTVFLHIDHNYAYEGPPILFETMVFDEASGASDLDSDRYSTWDEAEAGHKRIVEKWRARAKAEGVL